MMFWVRKMFDEVGGDIDRLLIQRFVSAKVRFFIARVAFFPNFAPKTNL